MVNPVHTEAQLEDLLAQPSDADIEAISHLDGDILILGASGKMGPSLVARARRAVDLAGSAIKVTAHTRAMADLTDRTAVDNLPDAANVIYLAGRKFGSTGNQPLTWAVNAWAPGLVANRFRNSRIVALSTGNVYPFTPAESGGATEQTPPAPVGEYAQSALARERIFEYFSETQGTRVAILRLNYAIDLRYGVLLEIGTKVFERRSIDLAMGHVNVIWQGDANSICLRALAHAACPALVLNVTGPETLSVRAIAEAFGAFFGVAPVFTGEASSTALLSNADQCWRMFGPPGVSVDKMILLVAQWIGVGGRTLNKPTHFEIRDGAF